MKKWSEAEREIRSIRRIASGRDIHASVIRGPHGFPDARVRVLRVDCQKSSGTKRSTALVGGVNSQGLQGSTSFFNPSHNIAEAIKDSMNPDRVLVRAPGPMKCLLNMSPEEIKKLEEQYHCKANPPDRNRLMPTISTFRGDYAFLSNFYPCEVVLDRVVYTTVEHAYQAAKSDNPSARSRIARNPSPVVAKQLGGKVILRPDWESIKLTVMEDLLRQKFAIKELGELLSATGDKYLVEDNYWKDIYWGVYKGKGENHLGKLLMKVRKELQEKP